MLRVFVSLPTETNRSRRSKPEPFRNALKEDSKRIFAKWGQCNFSPEIYIFPYLKFGMKNYCKIMENMHSFSFTGKRLPRITTNNYKFNCIDALFSALVLVNIFTLLFALFLFLILGKLKIN